MWCVSVMAGEVTEQQALQKAQRFMQDKQFKSGKSLRRASQQGTDTPFYIFNAEDNGGFVIVSADDRTEEILGYSDKGGIDVNNMPENLRAWLEGYSNTIKSLPSSAIAIRRSSQVREEIPILIKSQWSQHEPYNWRMPTYKNNKGEAELCITGCVATAMAQLMYYYRWPESAPAISGYTTKTYGINMPDLPGTTFQWDKMQDSYEGDFEEEAGLAVADLVLYCGQSVTMNYTLSNSGASSRNASLRLIDTFGYSASIREIDRSHYTTVQWEELIYGELSAKRPVMYSGDNARGGGHAFICDGYKDGMYHFNFGWGGYQDAYFVISAYSGIEYNRGQSAIIGIEPDKGQMANAPLTAWIYPTDQSYTRDTADEDFSVNIYSYYRPETQDFTGQWAMGLYQGEELIKILLSSKGTIIKDQSERLSINSFETIADGAYTIRSLYKSDGFDEWTLCSYSPILRVEISGLSMNVSTSTTMSLVVNNVEFLGKKKIKREGTMKLNITNNGTANNQELSIYLDESCIATQGINIDPGTTADIMIPYQPTTSGEVKVKVECKDDPNNPIWEGTVEIQDAMPQTLTGSVTIEGENNGTIPDYDIHGTITVTNTGSYDYDDDIDIIVYNNITGQYVTETKITDVLVKAGETKEITFDIIGLEEGTYYMPILYYSDADQNRISLDYKVIKTGYIPKAYALEGNVTGIKFKEGLLTMYLSVTNPEDYEYNDDFIVYLYRNTPGSGSYSWIHGESNIITIGAGETKTLVYTFNDIAEGNKLWFTPRYMSNTTTQEMLNKLFTVETTIDGDANGNGVTTIADAACVLNVILGKPVNNFNAAAADIDGDAQITFNDLTGILNIVLTNNAAASRESETTDKISE